MVLDCSTRFNISEENVVKLTETSVISPSTAEEFVERQKALHLLCAFFFEEDKILPQAILTFKNWCFDNRSLLEARLAADKRYLTRLIFAIDESIYLCLKSCCRA